MRLNNQNYKLIGALTSKPYAFMARSWELKIFESIDIFDNLGSNIRVDIRNFEILRILPKFNYNLNEDWISDKVRFCYDGLRKQRLNQPLIKKEGNLVPISWESSFNEFKKILNSKVYQIDSFCGELVDLETLLIFKNFLNKLGVSSFISPYTSKSNSLSYFRNLYVFNIDNQKLSTINNLIFINLNLRLENPILNLKIRKNVLKNNLKIFNIGFGYNLTYSFLNLGNNLMTFLKLIEGQSKICQTLFNNKLNYFFVGSNILYRNDFTFFIESLNFLKKYLKNKLEYSIFFTGSNTMSSLELGFPNTNLSVNVKSTNKILFLMDMDNISFDFNQYDFVCYQGHHGDFNVLNSNLVFPGILPYEKQSTFINLYGLVQKTENIIKPLNLQFIKEDWMIFKGLGDFLNLNLEYKTFSDINFEINRLISKSLIIPEAYPTFSKNVVASNSTSLNYSGNYYLTNSISRASLVMTLCAFRFKLTNFN